MVAFDRSAIAEDEWFGTHHRALREGRIRWLSALPIKAACAALDVGCGDGAFSLELTADDRIASLCLVDANERHLSRAMSSCAERTDKLQLERCYRSDANSLPYPDAQFDVTFCLNVLEYVADPIAAIRELARVTKPQGLVVLKDEDSFRDLLLPWPIDLEIAVNTAWADISRAKSSISWKPDAGRNLLSWVIAAGYVINHAELIAHDIVAPLTPAQEIYIRSAFANYAEEYRVRLVPAMFDEVCRRLAIGDYAHHVPLWLRAPQFRFQSLEYAVWFLPDGS